ncbi:hypothetical protein Tco_0561460 [Tanacetum coccineum]
MAFGLTGTSDSAQDPPPPPPSSITNRESDFEAQDMGSDDEDSGSRHIPKVSLNQEWFKPLSEEERPATPEPAWSIPSSSLPVPNNNRASAIASSFVSPPENSLLLQTGDIGVFMDWFCKKQGITELTPDILKMEECHKLLTNQVDEGLLMYNVIRPLLLGGPPGQSRSDMNSYSTKTWISTIGHKGDKLALSITKMKATSYPDARLEQMVPDQMWAEEEYMYDISASYGISYWTHMRILSVIRIEVFSLYRSPEPPTAQRQEDSATTRCQLMDKEFGYQKTETSKGIAKIHVPLKKRNSQFSDGTLHQIDEALDYRVKEFKVNKKRLKLRRIFRNLESFVGGRIQEGDYKLLQRTE